MTKKPSNNQLPQNNRGNCVENEKLLQTLFRNALDGIFIKNSEFKYLRVNAAYEKIVGKPENEILGKTSFEVLGEKLGNEVQAEDIRILEGEVIKRNIKRIVDKHQRHFHLIKMPLTNEDNEIVGTCGIMRDISELKELENKLLHLQKMESIGRLASGVANDVNNLLAGISAFASATQMELGQEPFLSENLAEIQNAVVKGKMLTSNLLNFASEGRYKIEEVDCNETIRSIENILKHSIPKAIKLKTDLSDDLPKIFVDKHQCSKAFMNICINAVEAMLQGGVLSIESAKSPGEERVMIKISDTGTGIGKEIFENVFEPFVTTKKDSHTGIGLSMAYGVINAFGGEIELDSKPGLGTNVKIFLPFAKKRAESSASPSKKIERNPDISLILLVDDEEIIIKPIKSFLEKIGYKVITAMDGIEAVDKFEKHSDEIDVVILDLIMPKLGGNDVFERIHKLKPDMPVIISTGYSLESTAGQQLTGRISAYIQKPFEINELLALIANIKKN